MQRSSPKLELPKTPEQAKLEMRKDFASNLSEQIGEFRFAPDRVVEKASWLYRFLVMLEKQRKRPTGPAAPRNLTAPLEEAVAMLFDELAEEGYRPEP